MTDTYGIPRYKEVNPSVFTCISFPFFFGVMFGDIMHGFLLFMFASYLCLADVKEWQGSAVFGRMKYFFLLMGFFSLFCGFIYNDFSSMTTAIFGTCYKEPREEDADEVVQRWKQEEDCVYPFGIDPVWYRSEQEIVYMNSLKMKASVIFGVAQMLLGTCMKGANAVHFRDYLELIFEVIPQVILMLALFGFMDLMIIVKWTTDWGAW